MRMQKEKNTVSRWQKYLKYKKKKIKNGETCGMPLEFMEVEFMQTKVGIY